MRWPFVKKKIAGDYDVVRVGSNKVLPHNQENG